MYTKEGTIKDRREQLRVKVKSIAAEAKMIRDEEQRLKRYLANERSVVKGMAVFHKAEFDSGRIKTGSTALILEWARDHRQERKRLRALHRRQNADLSLYNELRWHRVLELRPQARAAHLAYGFIRGREYSEMEKTCVKSPDWKEVKRLIERFGPSPAIFPRELAEALKTSKEKVGA